MSKRTWLLLALLGACSHTHGPQDSTQTGNPPALQEGRLTLEVSAGEVHITGGTGAVSPGGARIEVTNLSTGEVVEGFAADDGSFDLRVDGSLNDVFAVSAVASGQESPPVYVVRGGAAITSEDGSLSCDEYGELAAAVLDGSEAAAGKSCDSDGDCVAVAKSTSCLHDCAYAFVTSAGADQIETTREALRDGLCEAYSRAGCTSPEGECDSPGDARCVAGKCTAPGGSLSCEELDQQAHSVIAAAVATADTQCGVDSDCIEVSLNAECIRGCDSAVVSQPGNALIEAAVAEADRGPCATLIADDCPVIAVPCPAPPATRPRCDMGQCTLVSLHTDEGLPDCVQCISQTLQWGMNGGLVYYQDISELAPCARYERRRVPIGDPSIDAIACVRELVACNGSASTGAVLTALARPDVQLALSESPVVYGIDGRHTDVPVFEIRLGSQVIDVGGPCNASTPGCVSPPADVQALVDLLQAIDQQQLATDECAAFGE